jgi:hypothetical protein
MATGTWYWFNAGFAKVLNKEVDLNANANLKLQLHTSTYTPGRNTHDYQDDLTNEVANGNGYTTGGKAVSNPAISVVASASASAWAATTACVVAGTSGGSAPTWPTVIGTTVSDGTVTWLCAGVGYVKFDADDPAAWTSSTFTCRYGVLIDTTPGSAATNPLIGYLDFGGDVSPSDGSLTVTFHSEGIANFFS